MSNYFIIQLEFLGINVSVIGFIMTIEVKRWILVEPNNSTNMGQLIKDWTKLDQFSLIKIVIGTIGLQHMM